MKILTLNAGSSSIKYSLFENHKCLIRGIIERIGLSKGYKSHETAIKSILQIFLKKQLIRDYAEIKAVGHRVVHGNSLRRTTCITPAIIKLLEQQIELAPLHQPYEITGIKLCGKLLKCKQLAVFDTSFYMHLPEKAGVYAIPWKLSQKYGIHRFGFHGISHNYVYQEACRILKRRINRAITCHIGNGVSITAIKNGKAIDTSMGFTPLEGAVMGSRSGDIDAGIIFYLMQKEHLNISKMYKLLNEKSGLAGLCGKRDMRDVLAAYGKKEKTAIDIFCYKITKYIGAYAAAMGGVDALIFTAGIGEHQWKIRKKVCEKLGFLGVKLEPESNKKNTTHISSGIVKVMAIQTDEEQAIAEEALKTLKPL